MRYVVAFVRAAMTWVVVGFLMGVFIGQSFDGIEGWWQVVPVIGVWGTSLGIAAMVFVNSLKNSE